MRYASRLGSESIRKRSIFFLHSFVCGADFHMCGALDKKDLVVDFVEPPRWGERALFRLTLTTKNNNDKNTRMQEQELDFCGCACCAFFIACFFLCFFLFFLVCFVLAGINSISDSNQYIFCFNERTRLGFRPGFHKLKFRSSLPHPGTAALVRNRGILNRLCHGGLDCRNMATQFARSLVRNPAVLRQSWCERWVLRDF